MRTLQELAGIIASRLNPVQPMRAVPTGAALRKLTSRVQLLCRKAGMPLAGHTASHADPSFLSSYIEQYQCLLRQCMDILYADRLRNRRDPTLALRRETLERLKYIYVLLARHHAGYFDEDAVLPLYMQEAACRQLRRRERKTRQALVKMKADDALTKATLSGFLHFSLTNDPIVSRCYRAQAWLERLGARVIQLSGQRVDDAQDALERLLFVQNYNLPAFVLYYFERLTQKVMEAEDIAVQLSGLYACQRTVNRILCTRSHPLLPHLPSVKDQVAELLEQEIHSLERQLHLEGMPGEPDTNSDMEEESFEIIGVAVDLYAAHICVEREAGVLINKNQSAMIRSIMRHTRRKGGQEISEGSFRIAYYGADRQTKDKLKELYKRMLLIVS